jgi:ABC-type multidrug transport system fused ATPase/permease subunit
MKKSQKYFVDQQQYLGKLNGHIEEIYSGHTVVKAYNGEKNAKKVFDENDKAKLLEKAQTALEYHREGYTCFDATNQTTA